MKYYPDPFAIIDQFYRPGSLSHTILKIHGIQVAQKSLEIARGLSHMKLDMDFIEKAAILHDIGIVKTWAPHIGCTGDAPYVCHGYLGRELLDNAGLDPAFGLVAEHHTGAGITLKDILKADLPLPLRGMVPETVEEKIICCADKYFSKSPGEKDEIMTVSSIIKELDTIGPDHASRFAQWAEELHLT